MIHDKEQVLVCYGSCVGDVQNMRVIRFMRTFAADGYLVATIRPGFLKDPADSVIIDHYPLPKPKVSFWYNAGLFNLFFAIGHRIRNSFLLAWKLTQVRPDIIICCEPDSWVIAILAKLLMGCRVVTDLREVYDDRALAFPKFSQDFLYKVLRKLMRVLSRFTDEVIHVSPERQQIYNYLHKPGVVIGSYPEMRLFPSGSRSQNNENASPIIAIHVGALRPTYASEQLLDAMVIVAESTPKVRFVVLGGIAGTLGNDKLLDSLKNRGVLEFVQQVPFSEVMLRLNASDIGISLVLPVDTAHRLAAPQKLYEYFAASLPVVASDVPTIRRVVTDHECGIVVDASSPHEIADALIQLAQDADMRQRMGKNARRAAEVDFNWESQASKLCSLVKSLRV